MTATLLESAGLSLFAEARAPGAAGGRDGATLEERLDRVLRAVHAEGEVECPVCRATMRTADGASRCDGCGSTLS